MNHCIPNKKLWPENFPILNGFVVTSALAGDYTHYVFCESDWPLLKMPRKLFQCTETSRRMKNTEILRREKVLEFGDNIYFTADQESFEVLDYEKSLKVHETDCNYNKHLVKTICILPPIELEEKRCKIWSQLFGEINVSWEQWQELHLQAMHDVPIFTWVSIEVNEHSLVAAFYDFIEVAVDERKIAYDVDWNWNNPNRPVTSGYRWDTSDEEDECSSLIEKKEDQILDVKLKLVGYLISRNEFFCPEMKESRICIGLWTDKKQIKWENILDIVGSKFCFDIYYNNILQMYIAYYFEDISEGEEPFCSIELDEFDCDYKMIRLPIYLSDTYGRLYNSDFGLISDTNRILGTLPSRFVEVFSELDPEMDTAQLWVDVIDTGSGKKISRFVMADTQSELTEELIKKANEKDLSIIDQGFVYNSRGYLYAPKNATQLFVMPRKEIRNFPVGYWLNFEAIYNKTTKMYDIVGAEIILDKEIVPNNKQEEKQGLYRYQFKIEVEYQSKEFFLKGYLYNPVFGIVDDPEEKFELKRAKKYKVIVEPNSHPNALTLFKFVRMAKPNEKMEYQNKPKRGKLPYNEQGIEEPDNEIDDIGLDQVQVEQEEESDQEPPSQVQYLAEFAIRERKMIARERKRQRDKEEKKRAEELRQLMEQSSQQNGESNAGQA